jgi:hypothetical protein
MNPQPGDFTSGCICAETEVSLKTLYGSRNRLAVEWIYAGRRSVFAFPYAKKEG